MHISDDACCTERKKNISECKQIICFMNMEVTNATPAIPIQEKNLSGQSSSIVCFVLLFKLQEQKKKWWMILMLLHEAQIIEKICLKKHFRDSLRRLASIYVGILIYFSF